MSPLPDWRTMSKTEKAEALKSLCAAGHSATRIAGFFAGFPSRNAIIGMIHRMQRKGDTIALKGDGRSRKAKNDASAAPKSRKPRMPARKKLIAGVEHPAMSARKAPDAAVSVPTSLPAVIPAFSDRESYFQPLPDTSPIALKDLHSDSCRWPVDGLFGREGMFCDEVRVAGKPYCTTHHRIAYQPQSALKDKRYGAQTKSA